MFLNETRARVSERCLRQYYWSFLHGGHGIASKRPEKRMTWGILLHAGLAAHYRGESVSDAIHASLMEEFPDFDDLDYSFKNEWLEEVEWINKVVGRYASWAQPRDTFNVEGVEQAGSVMLGEQCWQCGRPYEGKEMSFCFSCKAEPHWFVFRLDLLVRDDYGYRVIDHKSTTHELKEHYLRSWEYSSQLWGYCYGAEKQSGHSIGGYSINIIRNVNAAGEEPDLTRSCPDCGRKKIKGCETCNQTGRVARAPRSADTAFHRENFTFTPAKRQWFIEGRVRAANKIVEHTRRFDDGDPSAFPHNPSSFSCDPDLCYGQRPGEPLGTQYVDERKYVMNGPDYVSIKRLSLEETS